MFTLYLPNSKDQKPLSYHYQTSDKSISDFLILGTLFRALPYFPQIYISSSSSQISKLQSILKNPSQIQFGQPKSKKYHSITISSQNNPEADLISDISINQSIISPQIISITGNGKGKTTIGLGMMLFNLLNNQKVSSYHFFKDRNFGNGVSEFNLPKLLNPKTPSSSVILESTRSSRHRGSISIDNQVFAMHSQNFGFLLPNANQNDIKKHQQSTQTFFAQIKKTILSQNYDLIFLDEIIDALIAGLINQTQIEEIIALARENNMKLVLTGRYIESEKFNLTNLFNTNIAVTKIKHPYDSGIKAVKGLDY